MVDTLPFYGPPKRRAVVGAALNGGHFAFLWSSAVVGLQLPLSHGALYHQE